MLYQIGKHKPKMRVVYLIQHKHNARCQCLVKLSNFIDLLAKKFVENRSYVK